MIKKMGERRKWKESGTEERRSEYWRLNNELRRETDKAREEWWEVRFDELEVQIRDPIFYNHEVSRLAKK